MSSTAYQDMIEEIAERGSDGPVWFSKEACRRFDEFCAEQISLWGDEGAKDLMRVCAHVASEMTRCTKGLYAPLDITADDVFEIGLWRQGVSLDPLPISAHEALMKWWTRLAKAVSATRESPPFSQIQKSIASAIALSIDLTSHDQSLLSHQK